MPFSILLVKILRLLFGYLVISWDCVKLRLRKTGSWGLRLVVDTLGWLGMGRLEFPDDRQNRSVADVRYGWYLMYFFESREPLIRYGSTHMLQNELAEIHSEK